MVLFPVPQSGLYWRNMHATGARPPSWHALSPIVGVELVNISTGPEACVSFWTILVVPGPCVHMCTCARPLNTSQICFAFCSRPNDAVDQVMNILMFVNMKQQAISISQHTSSAAPQNQIQSSCAMPGQAPRHISISSSLPFPGLWPDDPMGSRVFVTSRVWYMSSFRLTGGHPHIS